MYDVLQGTWRGGDKKLDWIGQINKMPFLAGVVAGLLLNNEWIITVCLCLTLTQKNFWFVQPTGSAMRS
jgi:hypothetical protein